MVRADISGTPRFRTEESPISLPDRQGRNMAPGSPVRLSERVRVIASPDFIILGRSFAMIIRHLTRQNNLLASNELARELWKRTACCLSHAKRLLRARFNEPRRFIVPMR